jgi:integrase
MPKTSKYPRFRAHTKRGKGGQRWTSYWLDNRGMGKPDTPLGNDYDAALLKWAELNSGLSSTAGTLEEAFAGWERDVLPKKTGETHTGYVKNLRRLRPVFGPAAWSAVKLPMLREYLKKRSGKTQANREIALLHQVWNWARAEGLTELHFPAAGMERSRWKNPEKPRQREVSDEAFAAIYKHADTVLRDALDIASATGLRVRDVLELKLPNVRGDKLIARAGKTGKTAEFDLAASSVLPPLIERRRASKAPHVFLLDAGRQVTERMLSDRFARAREAAATEVPECAGLYLRDMRKRAAQLAGDIDEASKLLQHSSRAVTRRHYAGKDRVRPVR